MDTNTIKIINSSFQFLGDIEDYISFYFVRNFTKAKEFQIVAPIKYINILKDDNIIFISPRKAGIIEEVSIDESKKIITAKGRDLKSVLCRRITVPPIGKVHDEIKSNVESVIKHYVINNCINPVDSKRKMLQLKINPNKNRGKTIAWQSRFKVLDLELEQICNCVGIGFEVYIDLEKKKFIFDIIEGRDRSGGNSTVIFSEEFDNITDSTHTNNSLSYRTMGYVASQDEEQDIGIKEVFKDNATGLERRELFIDATDIDEDDKLGDKAKSKLAEYDYITSNESTVINSNFQYEKDWNLGDIVLLKNTLGKSAQRVVEVTEIYEGNRKIEIVLGSVIPLFTEKITNEISNISSSVSNEKPSKIWRPSIDNDGNLIWNLNSSLDTPDMKNIKGPKGDKGDIGPGGFQGIQGIQGKKGDKGDKINHQWNGTVLKLENSDGSFDSGVNLKGDKGDRGSQGPKGDTGERGPQGVQGPAGNGKSYVVFHENFIARRGQQSFSWNDGYVYPIGINAIAVYLNGARLSNRIINQTSGNSIQFRTPLNEGDRVFIEAMQAVKDLQGPRGIQGPKGTKGDQGVRGSKGDKGDTGATGSTGPQGIQGTKGERGATGPKGNNGITPIIGSNGNWFLETTDTGKPSRGIQGDKGDKINHRWSGTILKLENPDGSFDSGVNLKGDKGDRGPKGLKGDTGERGPQGVQGPAGDGQSYVVFQKYFTATEGQKNFTWNDGYVYPVGINAIAVYINGMRIGNKAFIETSGNSITTKRALINGEIVFIEAMQAVKDLQGPRGPQGVQGSKGDKGETGERGLKGDKGDTGAIGPRGSQGSQGIQGPKGDRGLIGSKGNNGITPTIGTNGNWFLGSTDTRKPSRGIQGPRGIQGIQGAKGDKGNTGSVGPRGATGSRGLQGVQGPRGNTGPSGKDGTQIITSRAQPSGHIRGRVWIQTL